MTAILAPAKNMVMAAPPPWLGLTRPLFPAETARLAALLGGYGAWQFESAMRLSPELALKALSLHQSMDLSAPGSPALLAYRGLAYTHLGAADFTGADFAFAASALRILSAFYGLLRPTDGILPHRLEFQCAVRPGGKSLYAFWGDKIARALFEPRRPVVDLASAEYSKAVARWMRPGDTLVQCHFLTRRRGRLVTLATEAKICRGAMARYMVKERLDRPEALSGFAAHGYRFSPGHSTPRRYVFIKE